MRVPRLLLTTFVLFFLATLCASTAVAQTWYVQSADWGAGNRRQDVTNTVRRLVSGPNFTVNNTTMGVDPYKGADKTLRIVARDQNGNTRDFSYKEGSTVTSSMFRGTQWGGGNGNPGSGQLWTVQSADYGAGNRRQDVTNTVRRLVSGPNFRVNNQTMGIDPWKGADKTLRIQARDQRGSVREFKYAEGAMVDSSMFRGSGWNGGGGGPGWGGGGPGGPGGNPGNALSITSAQWGSGNRQQNVSQRLQNMIRNNRLSVKVTPQNMGGDPAPGVSKQLTVVYRWQGRTMNVTRVEGEILNLP